VEPAAEFVAAAAAYVETLEGVTTELTVEIPSALARFVAAALGLPDAEFVDEEAGFNNEPERRRTLEKRLGRILGDLNATLTVGWSSSGDEREAYEASLAYALATVYDAALDVLAGPETVWEWRQSFWTGWGENAAQAQLALYALFESRGPLPTPT
jgi:Domain of unknown function (DUF5063)